MEVAEGRGKARRGPDGLGLAWRGKGFNDEKEGNIMRRIMSAGSIFEMDGWRLVPFGEGKRGFWLSNPDGEGMQVSPEMLLTWLQKMFREEF